jgi:threonine synthase
MKYISTRGGVKPTTFEEAVLSGFASDGGLFVPESVPQITRQHLHEWRHHTFSLLATEVASLFIDDSEVPKSDLKHIMNDAFSSFSTSDIVPIIDIDSLTVSRRHSHRPSDHGRDVDIDSNIATKCHILELFHGPTLAFKDLAMQFVTQILDYFLLKSGRRAAVLVATSGDTGPAAIHASKGKSSLETFVLYPKGRISRRQELQMTSVSDTNIHVYGVEHSTSDSLDVVCAMCNVQCAV